MKPGTQVPSASRAPFGTGALVRCDLTRPSTISRVVRPLTLPVRRIKEFLAFDVMAALARRQREACRKPGKTEQQTESRTLDQLHHLPPGAMDCAQG